MTLSHLKICCKKRFPYMFESLRFHDSNHVGFKDRVKTIRLSFLKLSHDKAEPLTFNNVAPSTDLIM